MGQPTQSNNQNMGLQNLAWLGENGQVHTVNQNNQLGGRPMLGASMPPSMGLQNLAWLGENGQVHTVNQIKQPKFSGRPMLGAMPPSLNLQQLAWLDKQNQVHSAQNGMLGASSPMLINLGFLSDMKHKVADSGFVNTDGLDALHGKVDGLKEQASDLKDSAKDTAQLAGSLIDTDAVKAAAKDKLGNAQDVAERAAVVGGKVAHKAEVVGAKGAVVGGKVALRTAKAGAVVGTKAANFAMSDDGRAIISDGVQAGVQLGTGIATGNTLGAVIGGAKLAKDGFQATQGVLGASSALGDVILINLNSQNEYRNTPMYLY